MHQHIEACRASGKYVEEYCKEHNLKAPTYYYWRKKLTGVAKQKSGSFIEVQAPPASSAVKIVFTNGISMHFESLVAAEYLKQLVS